MQLLYYYNMVFVMTLQNEFSDSFGGSRFTNGPEVCYNAGITQSLFDGGQKGRISKCD